MSSSAARRALSRAGRVKCCSGGRLLTAGDDGLMRITDTRRLDAALATHKVRRVVYSVAGDEERIYAGCDDGAVRMFDHSLDAHRVLCARSVGGGFSQQQRAALRAAMEAVRGRED